MIVYSYLDVLHIALTHFKFVSVGYLVEGVDFKPYNVPCFAIFIFLITCVWGVIN